MSVTTFAKVFSLVFSLTLAACSSPTVHPERGPSQPPWQARAFLLGEVHDNEQGHQARLQFARSNGLTQGQSVTLIFEQINRDMIGGSAFPNNQCQDKTCLTQAIEKSGWSVQYYKPWVDLALENNWQVLPGNVSKADIGAVMSSSVSASFNEQAVEFNLQDAENLPEAYRQALVQAMVDGHCGLIDKQTAWKMGQIQVARDLWLASQIQGALATSQRVIVLAGNGHINKDIGIPFWLARIHQDDYKAVAFTEGSSREPSSAYDQVFSVPVADRQDPCEALKKRFK
ncbi:MAG: ChaN family lipoprotein [Limnobacter sp.]|nr:ChaN family lipoprotein [Limnobacter sp.]